MFFEIEGTQICLRHVAAIGPIDALPAVGPRVCQFIVYLTGGLQIPSVHQNSSGAEDFRSELLEAVENAHR